MTTRRTLANAIRALAMDAVQKANSGHPGMPMGMADISEVLWNDFLKHNPANPQWFNRDRFILSNGHGSMLQYALLHLSGYALSLDDLKNFRQLHSKTPGHPELGYTPGVETTTGPLGQGLANAVGMALSEKMLAAEFNEEGFALIDHYTYVFMGDGCLMEGISHEAASLAGTWGLNKLIAFWDDNGISIDGEVEEWFSEDIPKRFEAYGWHVISHVDGHDAEAIGAAIKQAQSEKNRPTLICCKTIIGFGAPTKQGKEVSHGAPLGEDEIQKAREALQWPHAAFEIPEEVYRAFDKKTQGSEWEQLWLQLLNQYEAKYPEKAKHLKRRIKKELPENASDIFKAALQQALTKKASIATRKASQETLNAIAPQLPELLGGSADLTGSNLTLWQGAKPFSKNHPEGRYLYYGVREFGMAAIANGIALHGGFIPYTATFLVFSDYARNAIRMAALMKIRQIFVFTHDSIGLGEDGPTHQPVEHLATLRLIPNMALWRPCDAVESVVAWQAAIEHHHGPTCLIFSRQNLAHQERDGEQVRNIYKGGYVLWQEDKPQLILLATGSEVALAMGAAKALREQGKAVRVVSMPSVNAFFKQSKDYQQSVIPHGVPLLVIEAGVTEYWKGLFQNPTRVIGIDRFGESAKAEDLFAYFGFSKENILKKAESF